jgi:hypothetical protein
VDEVVVEGLEEIGICFIGGWKRGRVISAAGGLLPLRLIISIQRLPRNISMYGQPQLWSLRTCFPQQWRCVEDEVHHLSAPFMNPFVFPFVVVPSSINITNLPHTVPQPPSTRPIPLREHKATNSKVAPFIDANVRRHPWTAYFQSTKGLTS